MSQVIAVRLPEDLAWRLTELSQRTRRPKAVYIREALQDQLDQIEWEQAVLCRREDIRSGRVIPVAADDVRRELGLEG